jgi:hypothetical protein
MAPLQDLEMFGLAGIGVMKAAITFGMPDGGRSRLARTLTTSRRDGSGREISTLFTTGTGNSRS